MDDKHLRTILTPRELFNVGQHGLIRLAEAVKSNRNSPRFNVSARIGNDVLGVLGEYAFCKAAGIQWESRLGSFHSLADADSHFEIRTACYRKSHLPIRLGDVFSRTFVLVTCSELPVFDIAGWIVGHEGIELHKRRFGPDPIVSEKPNAMSRNDPCWWCPHDQLRPIESLCV